MANSATGQRDRHAAVRALAHDATTHLVMSPLE